MKTSMQSTVNDGIKSFSGLRNVLKDWYTVAKITVESFLQIPETPIFTEANPRTSSSQTLAARPMIWDPRRMFTNFAMLFSEPETPIFMKALEDPDFRNFQNWCSDIKQSLREIKSVLDQGGVDPRLFRIAFLEAQTALTVNTNFISPFYYHQQLLQLENKIKQDPKLPKQFADIIREAKVRFREWLAAESKTKRQNYFYDDLINHIIQFSGQKIEADQLSAILNYYSGMIDARLHQQVSEIISNFINDSARYFESHADSNGTLFISLPNKIIETVCENMGEIFDKDDIKITETQKLEQNQKQNRYQRIKDYLQIGFNYAKENPKTILTATASVAALGYVYYSASNSDQSNALTMPQFPQWTVPTWPEFPIFSSQITNFLSYVAVTYGTNSLAIVAPRYVPILMTVELLSFLEPAHAQSTILGTKSTISSTMLPKTSSSASSSTSTAYPIPASFFKTLGGNSWDYGYSVQNTADNGIIVAGWTNSSGAGSYDLLVAKWDASGTLSWAETLGGSAEDYGQSIQRTTDNGFIITGYTYSFGAGSYDLLLTKWNASGTLSWARTLGGSSVDEGYFVQATNDGGCIVTGWTNSFGAGIEDLLLTKWDASGTLNWAKTLGGSNTYNRGYSMQVTSDDGFIVIGYTDGFGAPNGFGDFLLTKWTSSGTLSWARRLGGNSYDYGYSVHVTSDGGFIGTGAAYSFGAGNYDLLLAKWTSAGTFSWARTLGGTMIDTGLSVQVTTDGEIIVTGYTTSFGAGGEDLLLTKWSDLGTLGWAKTLGGSGYDRGRSVQEMANGDFIVAGWTNSFGAGNYDLLLAKLDVNGTISNCTAFRSITPTVNIISPNVASIAPTVQTISPTVRIWNIAAVPILPIVQAHCEQFPTSSSISSSSSSSSSSTSSSISSSSLLSTTRTQIVSRSRTGFFASSSSTRTQMLTSSTMPVSSTPFSATQSTDIISFRSTSEDKTSLDISLSEPGARVIIIFGIVLGIICGIGIIGLLGTYLLRKNKSTEEIDADDNRIELTDNTSQEKTSEIYNTMGSFFDKKKSKDASPYGKVPVTIVKRNAGDRESIYLPTPARVQSTTGQASDTTENPYGMTPSRVHPI